MTARLLCIEHYRERRGSKTYSGTRTYDEKIVELSGTEILAAGADADGAGEVLIGGYLPPTGSDKTYPYYTWEIRLKVELQNMVDYNAVFPLDVF